MLGVLSPAEVEDVLTKGTIGRLGLVHDGRPYVVPVCYAYADNHVYGHSMAGMKMAALQRTPEVCFEVEDVADLSNWRSVIAWGAVEMLSGTAAERGMDLLVDRIVPLLAPGSVAAHAAHGGTNQVHATVYRIGLAEKTGRFERQ
ncbi:MAG TPA: pyridoxamine 5'-phosphate oxidase family protein [Mycobacterium sp.]|nr:pyridoxamine 5'-phosphate oxidase family protein [Mycobacterium sp.]